MQNSRHMMRLLTRCSLNTSRHLSSTTLVSRLFTPVQTANQSFVVSPVSPPVFQSQTRRQSTVSSDDIVADFSREDGIAILGLNRPAAKNAMSKNLMKMFEELIQLLKTDTKTRVVILRSMVPGIFCAGADLKERVTMKEEEVGPLVAKARGLFLQLSELPMPTICALDGAAMGGGLEMALACDLRVASHEVKLGLVETRLAIIPGAGGTQRMPRLVGACKAKELLFTARLFSGEEAAQMGVVNHSVPPNATGTAAFERALLLAQEIAANGPVGVRMAKAAVSQGMEVPLKEAMDVEGRCYATVIPTKDRIEGLNAFKEKRKPKYIGQ